MTRGSLAELLRGPAGPRGYVSFLSALTHHGALIDALSVIQVASPERSGRDRTLVPGPVDFVLVPRDLFFGYRLEPFEGSVLPVASAEKALLDWVYLAEELAIDPRLDEIEWDVLHIDALDRLADECGIDYRAVLPREREESSHDQSLLRCDRLPRAPSSVLPAAKKRGSLENG